MSFRLQSGGRKLNLWQTEYKEDLSPILSDCKCYACRKHSRAYIHHLLLENELLAYTLIYEHNMHHMLRFMAAVRTSISEGTLSEFTEQFTTKYKS